MSEFQDLFMLSDVAVQNQEPIANAETMFGLSDSVNFGSSMRNSQDAAATAWAGIRPDTACTTPRNPSPRDTNETRRPQDGSAFAADVAESTGNSVPPNEVLLQNALLVMQSLAGALQNAQAAPQSVRPRVKLDMPSYSGYHDSKSANEYLDRLLHYQQATGLTDAELLARVVPVSLTEQAARGCNYADLEELAAAAKRIQGDILAAREYRPPPSAAMSVEPRCAWNGGATAAQARRANASATFADEQVPRGWELSDRALDPYAYALRTAHDSPVRDASRQEREAGTRPGRYLSREEHGNANQHPSKPLAAEESAQDQTERSQQQPRYDLRNRRRPCTPGRV
ncbi:hypothetical protein HPB50_002263 [Hyalomma asiaticum]|uniref:Uncharacterized protein n=1 Tax=Hyalomma asiaticum TaxID=266040 RepID=A0ACB7TDK2_HYAAI|nr:hypothetical protein HPB50_002263 [Hyalomma asiaticum]